MRLVRLLSGNSLFVNWQSSADYAYGVVFIYGPTSSKETLDILNSKPKAGLRNIVGDRPVTHWQTNGEVIMHPHSGFLTRLADVNSVPQYLIKQPNGTSFLKTNIPVTQYGQNSTTIIPDHSYKNGTLNTWVLSNISFETTWSMSGPYPVCSVRHRRKLVVMPPGTTVNTDSIDEYMYDFVTKKFKTRSYTYGATIPVWPTYWTTGSSMPLNGSGIAFPEVGSIESFYTDYPVEILPSSTSVEWGDLSYEAVQNAKYVDVNTGLFVSELLTIREQFENVLKLAKGKVSMKSISKAYLTWKYGMRLTLGDANTLISAAQRAAGTISLPDGVHFCRSMAQKNSVMQKYPFTGSSVRSEYHYKVYYKPYDNGIMKAIKTLFDWDLFPTLSNVWDLVPLSFVADWIVDIDRALSYLDYGTYVCTLSVVGVTKSTKHSIEMSNEMLYRAFGFSTTPGSVSSPLIGSATLTYYQRELDTVLDRPSVSFDVAKGFSHWPELVAILVSRK